MNHDNVIDEYSRVTGYNGPFNSHYSEEEIAFFTSEISRIKLENIRSKRNQLLAETDYMLLGDIWSNLTSKQQHDLLQYRQALRDLPTKITDIDNVTYPEKP